MKKSTLRRLNATTTTEATASNLNKIMAKRDARTVSTMDTDTEAKTVAKFVKLALTEFKNQFEAAMWLNIDTKATRAQIKSITIDDIEATKTATGTPDVRKLVSRAVARAEAIKRREAKKEAAKEARDIENVSEKILKDLGLD